ncbi:hypothetical protein BDN70DRAFT_895485 [Pholiota conissans]|uniref:Uncharacterized protein n=1 Tax=Pholiota conissans TaxID=109636 RepID=A0A9P5Z282_9AGAR|nr:hypothetical protein BDN70DRAFT_895485 [Pholiota conissans]
MAPAPIYLKIANVEPTPVKNLPGYDQAELLLKATWGKEGQQERLRPERNGFVGTVITAYGQHHHLIVRPDDVWLAILIQFNFYEYDLMPTSINANAEELRSKFVAHEGKKDLLVSTLEFAKLAKDTAKEIHKNIGFCPLSTTTTDNDTVVFAAALMATLKANAKGLAIHIIPPRQTRGIRSRANLLGFPPPSYIRKFVQAFDGEQDVAFWNGMVNREEICGGSLISGWISYFCVWSGQGRWQGSDLPSPYKLRTYAAVDDCPKYYLSSDMIAVGFLDFDLNLDDDGTIYDCIVVAGHLASMAEGIDRDTLRPQAGWFVFTKVAYPESMKMREKVRRQSKKSKSKKKMVNKWTPDADVKSTSKSSHGGGCFSAIFNIFRQ